MAFATNTQWEVRTTGSDSNGGGFDNSSTGTDYSQQDAAQYAYSDLVIGATTTNLSSAARPFVAADVGNVLNVTSGTGFTVQRVQINSVSGGVATCDKSCGTAASTGGSGNLGGGMATPYAAIAVGVVGGNTIWIKSGMYTVSARMNVAQALSICGYGTTHGDDGAQPTIHSTVTSTDQIFAISTSTTFGQFRNLALTGLTGNLVGIGQNGGSGGRIVVINCSFSALNTGINSLNTGFVFVHNCSFSGGSYGIVGPLGTFVDSCIFSSHSLAAVAATLTSQSSPWFIRNCLIVGCAQGIITRNFAYVLIENCTLTGMTASGTGNGAITFPPNWTPANGGSGTMILRNNIIYGNSGWGVYSPGSIPANTLSSNNAVGSNSRGDYSNVTSANDVTLTANPFSGSTYSLNSTAGGGADCKGAGWPGASYPGSSGTASYPDIGAAQSVASGGTSGNYGYAG